MKRTVFFSAILLCGVALAGGFDGRRADSGASISGRVVDMATGEPVRGARVGLQGSLTETAETSADGSFVLETTRTDGEAVVLTAGALRSDATSGYYNAGAGVLVGASGVEIALSPVSAADDRSYEFSPPTDCRACHGRIFDEYADAGHRNAAKNTWVKDLYDGSGTPGTGARGFTFKGVHPDLHGDCAECHAPVAAAKNPGDHTDYTSVTGAAYEWGVSCDLCHKTTRVTHPDLPGVLAMEFARGDRSLQFGPLADSTANIPGVMRASYSSLHSSSLLCSACHEDNSDHDFDGDYLEPGSVSSEATYSEWAESSYAIPGPNYRTCQDCHMQPKGARTIAEQFGAVTRDPSQVHSHDFEGTTDAYVRSAATLRLVARRESGRILVYAAVTNDRTGHYVPSGVTTRNAILLVDARTGDGTPLVTDPVRSSFVPEWGGVGDPALGYFAGLPGKGFAKVLTDGTNDNVFFTEATHVKEDTRIPAGVTDWSRYEYAVEDGAGERVSARVLYRRAFRAIADLKGWTLTGQGRPNPDLIGPDYGVIMSVASLTVAPSGPAFDIGRIRIRNGLRLPGVDPEPLPEGVAVWITDSTGAWFAFDAAAAIRNGGASIVQKGNIGGSKIKQFWPDRSARFLRVDTPDGRSTVLYLTRRGSRFELAGA